MNKQLTPAMKHQLHIQAVCAWEMYLAQRDALALEIWFQTCEVMVNAGASPIVSAFPKGARPTQG